MGSNNQAGLRDGEEEYTELTLRVSRERKGLNIEK